jgi:iron complex transport system substrate-binding protein
MGILLRTPFGPRVLVSLATLALAAACATTQPVASSAPSGAASSLASSAPPAGSAYPLTLVDDAGREVVLDAEPQRIVSLAPSNTEIVCALDACDRIVGVTDFDDYPEEVADVPDVVIQAQVDVELVVAAEPDLVLAAGNELTPSTVIDQLADLGLDVLVLYPESLDEVYADLELVGQALDRVAEAAALVAEMRSEVGDVEDAVAGAPAPRVLYEVFYSEGTTYTAGEGSFLASLIELAGGEPVTGDAEGVLGAEALVAADPELILLGTASYDPTLETPEAALAAVSARPGWADLAAVRQGDVVPYADDIVTTRPGPRIVEGLTALARAIHPDRFD